MVILTQLKFFFFFSVICEWKMNHLNKKFSFYIKEKDELELTETIQLYNNIF